MKNLKGRVVSEKMQKTATVQVWRWVKHPLYQKRYRRSKRYHADNTLGAKVGDKVEIVQTSPLSKTKRWRVAKILKEK